MTCTFCAIVSGQLAAQVVLDDDGFLGFLDHRPVFPGHVLLVPRDHHETLIDLPLAEVGPLFLTAQRIARAVEVGMEAQGTFVAINNKISQSVPHLHVHVVPRRKGDGLKGFFWPRVPYKSPEEMVRVRDQIRAHL